MSEKAFWQKQCGMGKEGTYGVAVAPTVTVPFTTADFNVKIDRKASEAISNRQERLKTIDAPQVLEGALEFQVEPDNGLGEVFQALLGTSEDSGASGTFTPLGYLHTFKPVVNVLPQSLTVVVAQFGTTTYNYPGCCVNELELSIPKSGIVSAAVKLIGQTEKAGTVWAGTFTTLAPFTQFGNAEFFIDGTNQSNQVSDFKVNIKNNQMGRQMMGTNKYISKVTQDIRDVTGEFEMIFADTTERNKFINDTASRLLVTLSGGTISGTCSYAMSLYLPAVKYTAVPWDNKDGVIGATIAFLGFSGTNAYGTSVFTASLTNDRATY